MLKRLGLKRRGANTEARKDVSKREEIHGLGGTVPEWLKEALECPVCWETIREPPIYMCGSALAHSLCSKCHGQVSECPICRGKLTDKRSHALENLIKKLPKASCRNDGCSFSDSDEELVRKHAEEECNYRIVACLCEEQVKLNNLVSHCKSAHQSQRPKSLEPMKLSYFRKVRTLISPLKRGEGTTLGVVAPYEVKVNNGKKNAVFLMNWTIERNCLIFWMSFVGPKAEAKNFKYSIKIRNFHNVASTEYVYEGARACVPCDISQAEMKEQRCGILIDRKLVLQSADYEDVLHYCIQIDQSGK